MTSDNSSFLDDGLDNILDELVGSLGNSLADKQKSSWLHQQNEDGQQALDELSRDIKDIHKEKSLEGQHDSIDEIRRNAAEAELRKQREKEQRAREYAEWKAKQNPQRPAPQPAVPARRPSFSQIIKNRSNPSGVQPQNPPTAPTNRVAPAQPERVSIPGVKLNPAQNNTAQNNQSQPIPSRSQLRQQPQVAPNNDLDSQELADFDVPARPVQKPFVHPAPGTLNLSRLNKDQLKHRINHLYSEMNKITQEIAEITKLL